MSMIVTEEQIPSPRTVKPVRALRSLYTPHQMDHLIHRERARADRTSSPFTLVLFKAHGIGRTRSMLRLAKAMLSRVRGTDEVGWYDEGCLAALLCDTGVDGARIFSSNVVRLANEIGIIPTFKIFSYPGEWFEDDLKHEVPGHESMPPDTHIDRREATSSNTKIESQAPVQLVADGISDEMTDEVMVQPMHDLLIHPSPWWKRVIDIAGASMGLLVFSPIMIISAILIKTTSKGPVLFKQLRSGIGGRPFYIYKFRTMRPDAEKLKAELRKHSEQDGPAFKMKNDPRVTLIGKFLRVTSLDELPQLLNVIKGDMSLVGPRPLPVEESDGCAQWQRQRLDVAPGLTCIWQVEGRSRVTFDEWMRMDSRYIRRRSWFRDMWLIMKTVPAVILRRGAQ